MHAPTCSRTEEARTARLRRQARCQGFWLRKGHARDKWYLTESSRNVLRAVLPELDAVENWLNAQE